MPSTTLPSPSPASSPTAWSTTLAQTQEVPFYERADWAQALADPAIKLGELPRISKQELRDHSPEGFLPRRFSLARLTAEGLIEEESTSGTSGASVRVIFGRTWWAEQEARALRHNPFIRALLTADPDAKRAVFTTPGCSGVSCFARWLNVEQRTVGSTLYVNQERIPFSLPEAKLAKMADETATWAPDFLDVDPVHGMWFALHCERQGLRFPSLRFILTSYEYTSVVHRRILERVFGVPVINLYGSSETGHLLIEADGAIATPSTQTATLELVDRDARGVGQFLVTTHTNPYLPLLRYAIGDYAEQSGAGYIVHGRVRDALRRADGSVATTRQVDALFADLEDIAHYQVRQQADGALEVFLMPVVPGDALTASAALLGSRLPALLGGTVTVRTGVMIAPEDSGKFRLTVRLG
jgi:phenylacetate-CoA ligase